MAEDGVRETAVAGSGALGELGEAIGKEAGLSYVVERRPYVSLPTSLGFT